MGTRLPLSVLCLVGLCNGCASSGVIGGTLSPLAGAESTPSSQERSGGPESVPGSVADAVIYVEELRLGVESRLPAAPGSSLLEVMGQVIRPRVLVVPVGTRVKFLNQDTLFHNLFSVSPARPFDLGRCGHGETKRVTFDKPGVVNVYCNLHPNMAAYIVVVPNRAFARPDSSGRFALPALPTGRYVVRIWHPDFPTIRRDVTVTGREPTELVVTLGS